MLTQKLNFDFYTLYFERIFFHISIDAIEPHDNKIHKIERRFISQRATAAFSFDLLGFRVSHSAR